MYFVLIPRMHLFQPVLVVNYFRRDTSAYSSLLSVASFGQHVSICFCATCLCMICASVSVFPRRSAPSCDCAIYQHRCAFLISVGYIGGPLLCVHAHELLLFLSVQSRDRVTFVATLPGPATFVVLGTFPGPPVSPITCVRRAARHSPRRHADAPIH